MAKTTMKIITGYKATNVDMTCHGVKFELGVWSPRIAGKLVLCERGYHFCKYPSGVFAYYGGSNLSTRVFKVEAREVLKRPMKPGADMKLVCRQIRLVEEVIPQCSHGEPGRRNHGYLNLGDYNTGDKNSGSYNTGAYNTGDFNVGRWNTGGWNTGNWNTGFHNVGNSNPGSWNTGDRNTGAGNVCSDSSGFFCTKSPKVLCFDRPTKFTQAQFRRRFRILYTALCYALEADTPPNFGTFKELPNITRLRLLNLWKKHQKLRLEATLEAAKAV